MVQCEVDPCMYYKIMESNGISGNKKGNVTGFLIVISWVDDCKSTMEGVSKQFVSIQLNHDIKGCTFKLTQEDYWVKAVERFKEFLGEKGPKLRLVPLSPADEKLLVEPTPEEKKEAEKSP
jgi:hypothetical protein